MPRLLPPLADIVAAAVAVDDVLVLAANAAVKLEIMSSAFH